MSWRIETARSRIGFSVRHMVFATVRGEFKRYHGKLEIDPDDFTRSRFEGEIEVKSLDTGNRERDEELRRNEFLDVAQFPKIKFVSRKVEPRGRRDLYAVIGDLDIRGVKRPIALEVEVEPVETSAGKRRLRLKARGLINRREFGVSLPAVLETGGLAVGDKVKIEIDAEAVEEG